MSKATMLEESTTYVVNPDVTTVEFTLRDFIHMFVYSNAICRLWSPTEQGNHFSLLWDEQTQKDTFMAWEIDDCRSFPVQAYLDHKVIGVRDILCDSIPEAINIVIQ